MRCLGYLLDRSWRLLEASWTALGGLLAPSGGESRAPEGSKSIPGGSLEALGSLLAPLEGSLAVLQASRRAPGAGLEASWAQRAPIWGSFWGHFFSHPGDQVVNMFFLLILGCISGSFLESFGAEETAAHQMAQHAKCIKNH